MYQEEDRDEILKKIRNRISKKEESLKILKDEKEELEIEKEKFDSGSMDKDFDEKLNSFTENDQVLRYY